MSKYFFILLLITLPLVSCSQIDSNLKEFADSLYSNNLCSDNEYKMMMESFLENNTQSLFDCFNFCKKAKIFYFDSLSDSPSIYMEQLHRDISNLLPELAFTDFNYKIVVDTPNSDNDDIFYDFVVSFKVNYHLYTERSNYRLYSVKKNRYYGSFIDCQSFFQIFNKVLSDCQSSYRIHEIESLKRVSFDISLYKRGHLAHDTTNGYTYYLSGDTIGLSKFLDAHPFSLMRDTTRFCIIALTKNQTSVFHHIWDETLKYTYANYANSLTSDYITHAITEYKRIGLLSHLSSSEIDSATHIVMQSDNSNLNDVLEHFPKVMVDFDIKTDFTKPYEEFTKELSIISHGQFEPTDIVDSFNYPVNNLVSYSFKLGNNYYKQKFQYENNWIDPTVLDVIKQADRNNQLNGQFYDIFSDDENTLIIYLTDEQYRCLYDNHLLNFGYESDDDSE